MNEEQAPPSDVKVESDDDKKKRRDAAKARPGRTATFDRTGREKKG